MRKKREKFLFSFKWRRSSIFLSLSLSFAFQVIFHFNSSLFSPTVKREKRIEENRRDFDQWTFTWREWQEMLLFFVFNVQVVGLVMLVALLDCGQSQDGLRFPNLFGGLTNFFRQATQQQPQPQQRPVNSQVSPGSGVGTTFPFLQAPPPAFQQPPQQQQQQQAPVFFQNTGKKIK